MDLIQSILNDNIFNNTKSSKENMALVYLHRYCYKGKAGDKEEITSEAENHLNLNSIIKHVFVIQMAVISKLVPMNVIIKIQLKLLKQVLLL